jgi:gluconolactonase
MYTNTCLLMLTVCASTAAAEPPPGVPVGAPGAVVDLATPDGAALVSGQWRYSDAKLVETDFPLPGPDRKPTGPSARTYDVSPHAGAADFDDSRWPVLDPATLAERRGGGKVCFSWYRFNVTIPPRIGGFDTAGSTVVFEIVVDDYAEVWVDGTLPRDLGQQGGSIVAGFNVPNRLVVGRGVLPGQKIQLAVFGMNGPISDAPANYIWIRSARLEFYEPPYAITPQKVETKVVKADPALDAIVPPGASIERLAEGFVFTEGPIWLSEGALLFSDPNANTIYKWTPDNQVSVFRAESGYAGADISQYRQPGSNGLTLDAEGRLVINEHGNRRVTRLEPDGTLTVLADRSEGRRLNSPNDLVYRSDGALYFTDPPFGLPKVYDDPNKELPYSGVFCLIDGTLKLVSTDLKGPNGIALSPREDVLYVANWDEARKVVLRYDVHPDGTLSGGAVFADLTVAAPGEEALDGLKVDLHGNVYVSAPGGVWIYSAAGKYLGTISGPERPANFAWGDLDGRTLYLAAHTGLYRIRLLVPGVRPRPG